MAHNGGVMAKDIQGWRVRPTDESGWCFSRDFAGVVATFEASPDVSSWIVERCAMTKAEWEGLGGGCAGWHHRMPEGTRP